MIIKGIRREMRKRAPLEGDGEGFTTVADGYEIADVEVLVDYVLIAARLASKAMANKKGISRYMNGAVTVKVVRRERVTP